MFIVTFILVAIFRKGDDSNDTESDSSDDGSPIYVDYLLGDINNINKIEVLILNYFSLLISLYNTYCIIQKGKSIFKKRLLSFI